MKGHTILRMAFAAVVFGAATMSFGQVLTLSKGASNITIINDGGVDTGMVNSWMLAGSNHLYQEQYFFRRGTGGAVSPLGALGNAVGTLITPKYAEFTYGNAGGMMAEVAYLMGGSGNNDSDLAEIVTITNDTNEIQHFELFEYDDFDLFGTAGDDSAHRVDAHAIIQSDGNVTLSAEVVTAPPANFTEVNGFPTLLNSMLDNNFTNLNTGQNAFGPGDASFAFQWVFNLNPGQSFTMSKDKLLLVPEPGTMVALGGLALLAIRKRKQK